MNRERSGSISKIRKREEIEEEEGRIFKKSAVITRSPTQTSVSTYIIKKKTEENEMEEILKEIQGSLRKLAENVEKGKEEVKQANAELRKEMGDFFKDIKGNIDRINEEIQELKNKDKERQKETINIEHRLEKLENKKEQNETNSEKQSNINELLKNMESKIEHLEKEKRKNNIIIIGIEMGKDNSPLNKHIEEFIVKKLKIQINIISAGIINQQKNMIIATVATWEEKKEIMKNKAKLKEERIYINNDLTIEERNIQKNLVRISKEQKELGKNVKIGYQKLIIEGKTYVWEDAKNGIFPKN